MLTCTFEDGGSTTSLRHTVTGMIVRRNDEILLERRAAHMTNPGKIAIPGGYINRDETAAEAAKREVLEETGYTVINPRLFIINDKPNRKQEDRQNIELTYIFDAGEKIGEPDNESAEIFWCPINSLPPKEDWAFDHYEEVTRYLEYLQTPCPLPITDFDY